MINFFHQSLGSRLRTSFIGNSFFYYYIKNLKLFQSCIFIFLNLSIPSYGQPSFDCNKAQYEDEITICSDATLSELDNIANYGYQYLRKSLGKQIANELDQPIINERQSCGSNKIVFFKVN